MHVNTQEPAAGQRRRRTTSQVLLCALLTTLSFVNGWLSQRDRDVNPAVRGRGRKRVGVGIYYFEDEEPTSHQRSNPQDA